MTDEQIKAVVLQVLGNIAPEIDLSQIDPVSDLRNKSISIQWIYSTGWWVFMKS